MSPPRARRLRLPTAGKGLSQQKCCTSARFLDVQAAIGRVAAQAKAAGNNGEGVVKVKRLEYASLPARRPWPGSRRHSFIADHHLLLSGQIHYATTPLATPAHLLDSCHALLGSGKAAVGLLLIWINCSTRAETISGASSCKK
jgi:hypothetical protein